MKTVEEDIKHLKERISYNGKRRQMAEDQRKYKLCDEINEKNGRAVKRMPYGRSCAEGIDEERQSF